jgi:hypothetical protein
MSFVATITATPPAAPSAPRGCLVHARRRSVLTAAGSLVDDIDLAEISDPGRRPIGGAASTATGAIGAESGRRAAREERHRRV